MTDDSRPEKYDVALSFAGEDREYVEKVAQLLVKEGIRVFYDKYEPAGLWGKDLYQHLDNVYRNMARYCVIFIFLAYANKLWTKHELKSAQARAFKEHREYILPVRFDDTELPGVLETVGYIDLRQTSPSTLVGLIKSKLKEVDGTVKPEGKNVSHLDGSESDFPQQRNVRRVKLNRAKLVRSTLIRRK